MYRHILVALDASLLAECALPHAALVAAADGADVTLVRVLDPPTLAGREQTIDPVVWSVQRDEARRYLEGIAQRLEAQGIEVAAEVLEGAPAFAAIDFAHEHGVDLVVLSSHGRSGLRGWNLGSVGRKTVEGARLDVLLVRAFGSSEEPEAQLRYRRLLVPLDGSRRAECAVPVACRLADHFGAHLQLAHVAVAPEMVRQAPLDADERDLVTRLAERNRSHAERYMEHQRQTLAATGRDVTVRVVAGTNAAAALHELCAADATDLVVISAHGASESTRLPYGSTVADLVAYGDTTLLIVQDRERHEYEPSAAQRAATERAGHG